MQNFVICLAVTTFEQGGCLNHPGKQYPLIVVKDYHIGVVFRMRPQKPRSRVKAGVAL